jgi:hypothetical protein
MNKGTGYFSVPLSLDVDHLQGILPSRRLSSSHLITFVSATPNNAYTYLDLFSPKGNIGRLQPNPIRDSKRQQIPQ